MPPMISVMHFMAPLHHEESLSPLVGVSMSYMGQAFCENVGNHFYGWNVFQGNVLLKPGLV